MRRTLKCSAVLVCIAVLTIAGLWLLSRQPGVTRTNAQRIARGSSQADVEARLGGPPGVHTSDGEDWSVALPLPEGQQRRVWVADDGAAVIDFNQGGLVTSAHWLPRQESVWTMIRSFVGL